MKGLVELEAVIERKAPALPRFVVIPSRFVAPWKLVGTTALEGTMNGVPLGRRNIKPWDEERWFIEIPEPLCRQAEVDTGDTVRLVLFVAPEEMPGELTEVLESDPEAMARWRRMTASQQRMLREDVLTAKVPATRRKRALRVLNPGALPSSD
jgi:Bacteriocin-protection, YdeI or OmpD-Associated